MALTTRPAAELAGFEWDYVPAPEARDIVTIAPRNQLYIGGKFVAPHSGKHFKTVDPATEEVLAEVAEADAVDVDRAVTAAADAFRSWSRLEPAKRARYIFRLSRIL